MNNIYIPKDYKPTLNSYDTQQAISFIKHAFLKQLSTRLNLKRVSAPLFVTAQSGLNDNLSGVERPVAFDVPAVGTDAQVVHSLAKWKRLALKRYNFKVHEGLLTDMNAIRRDEELDNIHSIYVDQWDWEKIISKTDRNISYLKDTVIAIVNAIAQVSEELKAVYPQLPVSISKKVVFVDSQELEDLYPNLSPVERENEFAKQHKTIFISRIGGALASGKPHGTRAPDYDDWQLNGDLIFWNEVLQSAFEISSMGIRVDAASLDHQLTIAGCNDRRELSYHKMLLQNKLPLTIGGGIGQSRLCMLLMGCAHIGEVQSSLWDEETQRICAEHQIPLL